ncbi:MAG: hypothetical protein KDA37_03845 [Planctomycetales bacterium]|nr:hypothetical protein [Planctomycetales bacterium]
MSQQATPPNKLTRVAVIGACCSGKTTFAQSLGAKTGLPHIELDQLYWRPNWTPTPDPEFRGIVEKEVGKPEWIIVGNYSKVRDLVWGAATTLVWLNYPFRIVFSRSLYRTFKRAVTREQLFNGNRETLRMAFTPEWIPWWVIQTHGKIRAEYPQVFQAPEYSHLRVLEFKHPRQAEHFLASGRS